MDPQEPGSATRDRGLCVGDERCARREDPLLREHGVAVFHDRPLSARLVRGQRRPRRAGPARAPGTRADHARSRRRWARRVRLDRSLRARGPDRLGERHLLSRAHHEGHGQAELRPFVVRDDVRIATYLVQSSVTTFQAYKQLGRPLASTTSTASTEKRASRVSFLRPYGIGLNAQSAAGIGAARSSPTSRASCRPGLSGGSTRWSASSSARATTSATDEPRRPSRRRAPSRSIRCSCRSGTTSTGRRACAITWSTRAITARRASVLLRQRQLLAGAARALEERRARRDAHVLQGRRRRSHRAHPERPSDHGALRRSAPRAQRRRARRRVLRGLRDQRRPRGPRAEELAVRRDRARARRTRPRPPRLRGRRRTRAAAPRRSSGDAFTVDHAPAVERPLGGRGARPPERRRDVRRGLHPVCLGSRRLPSAGARAGQREERGGAADDPQRARSLCAAAAATQSLLAPPRRAVHCAARSGALVLAHRDRRRERVRRRGARDRDGGASDHHPARERRGPSSRRRGDGAHSSP